VKRLPDSSQSRAETLGPRVIRSRLGPTQYPRDELPSCTAESNQERDRAED
jgi:hypothetical protein